MLPSLAVAKPCFNSSIPVFKLCIPDDNSLNFDVWLDKVFILVFNLLAPAFNSLPFVSNVCNPDKSTDDELILFNVAIACWKFASFIASGCCAKYACKLVPNVVACVFVVATELFTFETAPFTPSTYADTLEFNVFAPLARASTPLPNFEKSFVLSANLLVPAYNVSAPLCNFASPLFRSVLPFDALSTPLSNVW